MSFKFSRVSDQINWSILHLNHVMNLMQKFLMLFSEMFNQDLSINTWFINFLNQIESFFQVFAYVLLLRKSSVLFRFSLMKTVRQFTRSLIFMCFIILIACCHVFNFVDSSVIFIQNHLYEVSKQLSLFNLMCSLKAMTCICN